MRTFVLSAVGADRPGIIAAVAERLVAHGVNVTDSQMGILRGRFAMTLLVTAPDDVDEPALAADVEAAGQELRLDTMLLREVGDAARAELEDPTHVVDVHGADHPGILAAVTRSLAAAGVNVCDLRTRLTSGGLWVMVIHVAVPAAADEVALAAALHAVGEREGVAVTLHAAEPDLLQVVRDVLLHPDPRLTRPAAEADPADVERVARDLVDTMRASPRCVGVAAPQIGECVRIVAVDCTGHPKVPEPHGLLVLVSPVVVAAGGDARGREGCLSIPDLTGDVHRPTDVVVEARTPGGDSARVHATGFEARVLLHEIDHLDGILFLDRAVAVFPRRSRG